jgi:hypothetical protein
MLDRGEKSIYNKTIPYQERWRDGPDETRQPMQVPIPAGKYPRKMRTMVYGNLPRLYEAFLLQPALKPEKRSFE